MKKKGNFRKVVSGLLAGMTMLSTVLSPMTAYAAEIQPEEKPPLYEEVKDLLDEDEVVTAKDYEIETGSVFDVKSDYTGLEIKDDNKVKVTFEEAKNDKDEDFTTDHADTYKAVYYVEPVNQEHPKYQISRKLIVREKATEAQTETAGSEAVTESETAGSEQQTEEAEDSEADSEITDIDADEFDDLVEQAQNQDTYDEESGLELHDVLEQAGDEGVDLDAMEEGEIATFEAVSAYSARSTQQVTIEKGPLYRYADYNLGTYLTEPYYISYGNVRAIAYCVQPAKPGPGSGNYTITKIGDNQALAKVCYYGTDAAGSESFFANKHTDFSEGKRFIIIHMAASYANGSSDGGSFRHWLKENNPKPYGSYGNGSAMRVSAVGWLYDSMERTREVARATANVTHNHPEGIKGAESTASAIYMARNGSSKEEIKTYIEREFHYDLSRTLDNIRTYYHHVESCQETVPEAIIAFLESKDFEDAIRNAVSLGGDTDTLGAITGSIAEAFYGIPAVLIAECKSRIDKGLMTDVLDEFDHVLGRSVDTYSDEVDETQANQMIEAAIDQYYIQQDKNGMLLFMEVMVTRMQQAGEVIVPYITENPFMSEEQISKVKAGDTISLDHDVRLKIETVKDSDEKEWIGVFTSSEEMHKGSAGNVQMNQSIESILRLALNWEQVNGIVINPFGKYIQMTKKMIELLINGYEYNENERKSKDDENN